MKKELYELFERSYKSPVDVVERFKKILEDQPTDFFGKKSNVAHITGSALVVNEDATEVLLTNHKKLKRWLQLGGHWCDFDDFPTESITDAALREVREEGYNNKDIPIEMLNGGNILDLDIHDVGGHLHYDVCFIVKIDKSVPIHVSTESEDLAWKNINGILQRSEEYDARLVRMLEKSNELKDQFINKQKFKF